MGAGSLRNKWLRGSRYHFVRVFLFALACAFIVVALIGISLTTSQVSRIQQIATEMVKTEPQANVLVLTSHSDSDSATKLQTNGILVVLRNSSVSADIRNLDVSSMGVSLDRGESPLEFGQELLNTSWGQALAEKIANDGPYMGVICVDDDALCYAQAAKDTLFANTPIVFTSISDAYNAQAAFDGGYATGVIEEYKAADMAWVAQHMRPNATQVLVVTDNTATGMGERKQIQEAFAGADVDIEYLNSSTMSREELGNRISEVGEETLLFYLGGCLDSDNNGYSSNETAYFLAEHSSQPIFSLAFNGGVGEGFIGSFFLDYEEEGAQAGRAMIEVLNAGNPSEVPLTTFSSSGMVFDASVMNGYGISQTLLPTNAVLLNDTGVSFDSLRTIAVPLVFVVVGLVCILIFWIIGYRRKVTEIAEVSSEKTLLEQQFYTDGLTGLPNMQWLTHFASTEAVADVGALVEIALVNMDTIEATRGTAIAKRVVQIMVWRLSQINHVFLIRVDKNTFIMGADHELKRGDKFLKALIEPLHAEIAIEEFHFKVDVCVSVVNREFGASIEEAVSGADIAIRHAQQIGTTDEVIFYDKNMRHEVSAQLAVTTANRRALDNNGFVVTYQPLVDLGSNSVVAYEAKVRMKNDQYKPEHFLPVAEMAGQIVELDRYVTKRVVQQLAKWKKRKQRMRPVAINYSASLLQDEHYIEYVSSLLDDYELSHALIRIEVNETMFIEGNPKLHGFVARAREAGFEITVDGFGSGYTSLSRVMQVPAHVVKIDRAVTAAFLAGGDINVIGNLVRMLHSANKEVVIEGVETPEQLLLCKQVGCDVVQGSYISEPVLPERAVQYKPDSLFNTPEQD